MISVESTEKGQRKSENVVTNECPKNRHIKMPDSFHYPYQYCVHGLKNDEYHNWDHCLLYLYHCLIVVHKIVKNSLRLNVQNYTGDKNEEKHLHEAECRVPRSRLSLVLCQEEAYQRGCCVAIPLRYHVYEAEHIHYDKLRCKVTLGVLICWEKSQQLKSPQVKALKHRTTNSVL